MSKLLIINADDLGLSKEINTGILQSIECGAVSDTSLLVKAPYARHAVSGLKSLGIRHLGIHINLDDVLGWRPGGVELNDRHKLLEMLDEPDFIRECMQETTKQIEIFLSFGLTPSHIDTHHHVHGFAPIFEVLLDLSGVWSIPAMRFSRQGYRLPTREDIPFDDELYGRMEVRLRQKGINFSSRLLEGARMIDVIYHGTTELVVHPSLGGETWRSEEFEILRSRIDARELDHIGIKLISFKDFTSDV
ncbi:MAG TPA: ChbG/HpnK family deacetylase [Desulfomonilia bacterium]|nr:ChbG/HpnK family deacetylase [Desulfomonilia bacterium]